MSKDFAVVFGSKQPEGTFGLQVSYSVKGEATLPHDDFKKIVESQGLTPFDPLTLKEAFNQVVKDLEGSYRNGVVHYVKVDNVKEKVSLLTKVISVSEVDLSEEEVPDQVHDSRKVAIVSLDPTVGRVKISTKANPVWGREAQVADFAEPPAFLLPLLSGLENAMYARQPLAGDTKIRGFYKRILGQYGIPAFGLDTEFTVPVAAGWVVASLRNIAEQVNEKIGQKAIVFRHGFAVNYSESQVMDVSSDVSTSAEKAFFDIVTRAEAASEKYQKKLADVYEASCEAKDPEEYFGRFAEALAEEEKEVLKKIEEFGCILTDDLKKIEDARTNCEAIIKHLKDTAYDTLEAGSIFGLRPEATSEVA